MFFTQGKLETSNKRELEKLSLGLFVRLEAKPGKEDEVADLLMEALETANQETTTPLWFGLRLGPSTFVVFDAVADDTGRQTHFSGFIAKALTVNATDLLAAPPSIEITEVLGARLLHEAGYPDQV